MNLNKLFEIQEGLDYHIKKEKGLEGQDLLDMKILSLQVELGECANEWRGFKFWSNDQEPRNKGDWKYSTGIENGRFIDVYENPLLEEYVDCLHFILSVGLELELEDVWITQEDIEVFHSNKTTLKRFKNMFRYIDKLIDKKNMHWYEAMFGCFIGLGQSLGFTWNQIEQAYLDKNKINHERQLDGY